MIISYMSTGFPQEIPEPSQHRSLKDARNALGRFAYETGSDHMGGANASLYVAPRDVWEDMWSEAERFSGIGCPFDYPSYILSIGPRGGVKVERT